jgi:hypothetical protein
MNNYADDNDSHFLIHATVTLHFLGATWPEVDGSGSAIPGAPTFFSRKDFRDQYLGRNNAVFYCPSAKYDFNPAKGPKDPENLKDNYHSYAYWGGVYSTGVVQGNYLPEGWNPGVTPWTPTISLTYAQKKGNVSQRPLFMDNAGYGGPAGLRQESASKLAFPVANHAKVPNYPDYENILFVDMHNEGIANPVTTRPLRISYQLRWGDYFW